MSKVVETREYGLKLLDAAGYDAKREGKGISYNIRIKPDIFAHVKVGTKGGPIIRAQTMDVNCEFNGLGEAVTHLFYINRDRKTDEVTAYLIPKEEAVAAFQAAWASRLEKAKGQPPSDMVSIGFHDGKNDADSGYQRKFAKYQVQPTQPISPLSSMVSPLSIEDAKKGLAAKFGVKIDAIKISIEM